MSASFTAWGCYLKQLRPVYPTHNLTHGNPGPLDTRTLQPPQPPRRLREKPCRSISPRADGGIPESCNTKWKRHKWIRIRWVEIFFWGGGIHMFISHHVYRLHWGVSGAFKLRIRGGLLEVGEPNPGKLIIREVFRFRYPSLHNSFHFQS